MFEHRGRLGALNPRIHIPHIPQALQSWAFLNGRRQGGRGRGAGGRGWARVGAGVRRWAWVGAGGRGSAWVVLVRVCAYAVSVLVRVLALARVEVCTPVCAYARACPFVQILSSSAVSATVSEEVEEPPAVPLRPSRHPQ